jgi:hypothetical protein
MDESIGAQFPGNGSQVLLDGQGGIIHNMFKHPGWAKEMVDNNQSITVNNTALYVGAAGTVDIVTVLRSLAIDGIEDYDVHYGEISHTTGDYISERSSATIMFKTAAAAAAAKQQLQQHRFDVKPVYDWLWSVGGDGLGGSLRRKKHTVAGIAPDGVLSNTVAAAFPFAVYEGTDDEESWWHYTSDFRASMLRVEQSCVVHHDRVIRIGFHGRGDGAYRRAVQRKKSAASKELLEESKMRGHGACLTHPAPQLHSGQSKMRGDGEGLVVDEIGEGLASGITAVLSAAVMMRRGLARCADCCTTFKAMNEEEEEEEQADDDADDADDDDDDGAAADAVIAEILAASVDGGRDRKTRLTYLRRFRKLIIAMKEGGAKNATFCAIYI